MAGKKISDFFAFIAADRWRRLNFSLVFLILSLLPVKNYYTDIKIEFRPAPVNLVAVEFDPLPLYPINISGRPAPVLTAVSALAIDIDSKAIIYAKNPDQKLFPASTTKLMTALVALDYYQLEQVIEIKEVKRIGQIMGLQNKEKITFENLLYGLLVKSGNDSAYALAQSYPGGIEAFVQAMNEKAKVLHLEKTNFTNPAGLDYYNHLSTAHDLAVLATAAMENPIIKKIVNVKQAQVADTEEKIIHNLENVNRLLGKVEGLQGIKTGRTENAGECLISYTERDNKGVIIVILASRDRFGETEKLIDWIFNNYEWKKIE